MFYICRVKTKGMKSIEERANRIAGVHPDWSPVECMRRGYIEGAKEEHKLLTEWHAPNKEVPNDDHEVLVKTADGDFAVDFYVHELERFYIEDVDYTIRVIGWREIHE